MTPLHHEPTQEGNSNEEYALAPATPRNESSPRQGRSRRMLVVFGVVFVCGAIAVSIGAYFVYKTKVDNNATSILTGIQNAPALHVKLVPKRMSLSSSKSVADAYIFPRGGVVENGVLQFDGLVTQVNPEDKSIIKYTLLNDRGYRSKELANGEIVQVDCLQPSQVPPIQLMTSSLSESSVVDDLIVDGGNSISCASGKLLQLQFAGETFVFCNSNDNKLQHATSDDLDLSIQYLMDPTLVPTITAPVKQGETNAPECPIVVSQDVPPSKTTTYAETASSIYNAAMGPTRSVTVNKASCGCRSVKKPCLFVHGVGLTGDGTLTDTHESYWGNIHEHAPCCSSIKFVNLDTTNKGWTDPDLQKNFCDAALFVTRGRSYYNTVDNLILVTHSMGNLIAGGAAASGICNFGRGVTWISLAGPMQGSQTANFLDRRCAATGFLDQILSSVLQWVGYCPTPRAYSQLKHQSTVDVTMQTKFKQAQEVRRAHGARVLCGTDSFGLVSLMSVPLAAVGSLSNHQNSVHDGVVDYNSCASGYGGYGFSDDTSGYHYKAAINHIDATFRNGDGWWGSDRKPQKWFECSL